MKKLHLLGLLIFALSLGSCTFTENIYINDDGTGKFSLDMDGSSILAMVPEDSLKNEKSVDTTIYFKDIIKEKQDSISKLSAQEQAKFKKMENFVMNMKMNAAQKQMLFSLSTNFKNVSELGDAFSTMGALKDSKKDKSNNPMGSMLGGLGNNDNQINYTYDGKKFTRKGIANKAKETKDKTSEEESMQMILESSTYVVKYHFPKAVKKVSNDKAQFSEDRKTITIEYPFTEYKDTPEKLNFEVEFQK
ncbi:hypothetical protein Q361_10311 [Flavobacterium croceum DSM 17960]|uniref:Lipoprotein n=1 Tax=Flavobacterium croceum DSM 17960 TaxID=1121886 RepID=A0A2S4NA01_9FLAO|nr:hypothetical protein [Flavobacterium croceum]POS02505.1 hypothetical protein Q361_10311 [Flavobacterium croceum DSM 17960]